MLELNIIIFCVFLFFFFLDAIFKTLFYSDDAHSISHSHPLKLLRMIDNVPCMS